MARGGARPNAGRKVGAVTKRTREVAEKAASEGLTPLEYLLERMRDEGADEAVRMEAAKSAAPYVHAKLSSVEMNAKIELADMPDEELDARLAAKLKQG